MLLAEFTFWQAVWAMFIFFAWVMFIVLLVNLFLDVIRRDDLSGWAKAAWTAALFFVPFIGALIYIAVRPTPTPREVARLSAAQSQSPIDEIARLDDLRSRGAISDAEFEQLKRLSLA